MPPREVIEQLREGRILTNEAESGDPTGLIMYLEGLRDRGYLDPIVYDHLAKLLEAGRGHRYHERLREIEQFLIGSNVEERLREARRQYPRSKVESIIKEVMDERQRGRTFVREAWGAYKRKYPSD
jgi:hypothetical protein